MAIDANGTNTVPFKVSTQPGFVCGTTINFTLTVSFTGGSKASSFSLPTCTEIQADTTVNGSIDPADPKSTQGRIARNGVVSSCGIAKACPGALGAGGRSFDQYSFTNPGLQAACVTLTLTSAGGANIIGSTYLGSYNPADTTFCVNYLGDAGASGNGSRSWQVDVPAGGTIVVVVMEASAGTPSTPYSVKVHGVRTAPVSGPGSCENLLAQVKRTAWTSASSAATLDEDSAGKVIYQDFTARLKTGVVGTATIRYNITATDGVAAYCPATQSVVNVRFRNSDNTGVHAQVKFEIHRTNITAGGNDIIFSFNSNGLGAGTGFTTASIAPNIDFDFSKYVYWIEGTITRDQASQFADLGSIDIYELDGTTLCP